MSEVRVCLITVKTNDGLRSHMIEKPVFTIGRTQDADLQVLSSGVSRSHLKVEIKGDDVWVTDQKSANGTFLNGDRIEPGKSTLISQGDFVKLGLESGEIRFMAIPRPFELGDLGAKRQVMAEAMEELALHVEKEAKGKIDRERDYVRIQSEQILSQARKEAEVIKTQGILELQNLKSQLEADIARLQQEFQMVSAREKMTARKEADRIMSDAQKQIQKDYEESSRQMDSRLRENQVKCLTMLEQAELKAQENLAAAQQEATQVRKDATDEARKIKQDTLRSNQEMVANLQESFQTEIKQKRIEILQQARADALAEREAILREVKTQDEIRTALKGETTKLEEVRSTLHKEIDGQRSEVEAARKLIEETKKSEERRKKAEQEYLEFKRIREEGQAKIEAEFRELRNRHLVDTDARRKELDQEINKSRSRAIDDIKKEIDRREADYEKTRKLRAVDLVQRLQEKLLPHLPRWQKNPEDVSVEMKTSIEAAVTETLLKEGNSIQIRPDVISQDSVKVQARSRQINKYAIIAAGVALVIGVFFRQEIMRSFSEHSQNSYAAQVVEQRKLEAVYKPEQTDLFYSTYYENVLYMKGYYETKIDPVYIEKWTLRLNDLDLAKSLKINEEEMVAFIAKESGFIKRLGTLRDSIDAVYLNEGLERMKKVEEEERAEMVTLLKSENALDEIRKVEETFLREFQANQSTQRLPSSGSK